MAVKPYTNETIPGNKGNEAMAYLTYLIEHLSVLPDIVVFAHPHEIAWHNSAAHYSNTSLMLREINYHRVKRLGYMNLRCDWTPGCPSWIQTSRDGTYNEGKGEEWYLARVYDDLFGTSRGPLPPVFGSACCAQFVVSRERIQQRVSLSELVRWRQWLLDTKISNYFSGRIWEYLWHFVFSDPSTDKKNGDTKQSINCPSEFICYCDGYGVCFEDDEAMAEYRALRNKMYDLTLELNRKVERGPLPDEDLQWRGASLKKSEDEIEMLRMESQRQVVLARERGRNMSTRKMLMGKSFSA